MTLITGSSRVDQGRQPAIRVAEQLDAGQVFVLVVARSAYSGSPSKT
ncbi:MAG TPA: hypothetical protein VMV92_29715 [Streptosporangiaceae bacterium]|nr:hypothetical protein [Streptosporangiaceae bacterium]